MRSWRRRSSVSMFDHESRMRFRCRTNRLYDNATASRSAASAPNTTHTAVTAGLAPGTGSTPRWARARGSPGALAAVREVRGPHPARRAEEIGPHRLERAAARSVEQERHHARVDDVVGELPVPALHAERAVELLRLELDVVEAERSAQTGEHVLTSDRDARDVGVDRCRRAREAVVAAMPASLRVGALVVVPVVEEPNRQVSRHPPEHVLDAPPVAPLEQREGEGQGVERIVG